MPRTSRGDADGAGPQEMKWRVTRAVRASCLPAEARLIMHTLADMSVTGTAELPPGKNPSTAQLARETGQSETTVKKYRKLLEKDGWIVYTRPTLQERVNHLPGSYTLKVPPTEERLPTLDEYERGAHGDPRRGSSPDPRNTDRGSSRDPREGRETTLARGAARPSSKEQDLQEEEKTARDAVREAIDGVCAHLADRIAANGTPRPPVTEAWRTAAAALLYEDGHTPEQLVKAIDFAHGDDFWRINVVSPARLREHYHSLRLSADRARNRAAQSAAAATPLPPPVAPLGEQRPAPAETLAEARARVANNRAAVHAATASGRPAAAAFTPPTEENP